ncbi:unnamed protein product, partial [Phaeothamnion confervicola]
MQVLGHTALTWACRHGNTAAVEVLSERGANVDRPTGPKQRTPLAIAAMHGHHQIVRMLLERGAEAAAADIDGATAADLA